MDKIWKIEVVESRRTKNSALIIARYCGGKRGTFKFQGVVTLTPQGRKDFSDQCERRLAEHLQRLESIDPDLVDSLEAEINSGKFAIDEIRKKEAEEKAIEDARIAEIKRKQALLEAEAQNGIDETADDEALAEDDEQAPPAEGYADDGGGEPPVDPETPDAGSGDPDGAGGEDTPVDPEDAEIVDPADDPGGAENEDSEEDLFGESEDEVPPAGISMGSKNQKGKGKGKSGK